MDADHNVNREIAASDEEGDLTPAQLIGELLQERKFCAATRLYSEMTGSDLVESKLAIDRLAQKHNLAPAGCLGYLVLLVSSGSTTAWAFASWLF